MEPAPGVAARRSKGGKLDVFVARQPILDAEQQVYGYELLFRDGVQDGFPSVDPDMASTQVIGSTMLSIGLDVLTHGKPAFVNFSREALLGAQPEMLPIEGAVIEIVESVEADNEVVAACIRLKDLGYRLALDDFTYRPDLEPLLGLADFVKIDFELTDPPGRRELVNTLRRHNVALVAEKVETVEDFQEGVALGCTHFQGYFFSRPVVYRGHDLRGHRASYAQLIAEASQSEIDLARLETIIKTDVSLSYKLLRYINSVSFGWKQRIASVGHALALLGQDQVHRWAMLVSVSGLAEGKPTELSIMSALRARLCEGLAGIGVAGPGVHELDGFMLGMFSLMDAILDTPMAEALEGVPLSAEVSAALLGEPNRARQVLDAVVAYERGRWGDVSAAAQALGLPEHHLPRLYTEAVEWASAAFD